MEIIKRHWGMIVTRTLKISRYGQPLGSMMVDYTKGMSQEDIKALMVKKADELNKDWTDLVVANEADRDTIF